MRRLCYLLLSYTLLPSSASPCTIEFHIPLTPELGTAVLTGKLLAYVPDKNVRTGKTFTKIKVQILSRVQLSAGVSKIITIDMYDYDQECKRLRLEWDEKGHDFPIGTELLIVADASKLRYNPASNLEATFEEIFPNSVNGKPILTDARILTYAVLQDMMKACKGQEAEMPPACIRWRDAYFFELRQEIARIANSSSEEEKIVVFRRLIQNPTFSEYEMLTAINLALKDQAAKQKLIATFLEGHRQKIADSERYYQESKAKKASAKPK